MAEPVIQGVTPRVSERARPTDDHYDASSRLVALAESVYTSREHEREAWVREVAHAALDLGYDPDHPTIVFPVPRAAATAKFAPLETPRPMPPANLGRQVAVPMSELLLAYGPAARLVIEGDVRRQLLELDAAAAADG